MKKRTIALLFVTHCSVAVFGFSAGIYLLPILTAPAAPSNEEVKLISAQAKYSAQFSKDRKDSDMLHWGEGTVSIGSNNISFIGKLAPGPDYKLYLSPKYLETEADFHRLKSTMVQVGNVTTFNNFVVKVPTDIKPSNFTSVIIWCEAFNQFITSAKYQ